MNTERRCLHPQDLDVPHKRLKTHQRLDLGTETESEKLLQEMLYRQLDTNFSIKQLAKQHKSFTPAGNYVQLPVAGTCSLNEYISIGSHESQKQRLLQCGLTTEEVQLYLEHQGSLVSGKVHPLMDPAILENKLREIENKIRDHTSQLTSSGLEPFSGAKQLSRSEMDIEKTLYANCPHNKHYKGLIVEAQHEVKLLPMDPMSHIAEFSKTLMERINAKKRTRRRRFKCNKESGEQEDSQESCNAVVSEPAPDPAVFHAVVPLPDDDIRAARLGLDEIRKLPRFQNYSPGHRNSVLYLKNLHHTVDIRELIALFCRFDLEHCAVKYRLLSGRLRGQAFVTLPSAEAAERALNLCNGYVLRGRPMIIEYGRTGSS